MYRVKIKDTVGVTLWEGFYQSEEDARSNAEAAWATRDRDIPKYPPGGRGFDGAVLLITNLDTNEVVHSRCGDVYFSHFVTWYGAFGFPHFRWVTLESSEEISKQLAKEGCTDISVHPWPKQA